MTTEILEKCDKCHTPLEYDDDVDYDGARYIGGSKYKYCPNIPDEDDLDDYVDGHTFERYS